MIGIHFLTVTNQQEKGDRNIKWQIGDDFRGFFIVVLHCTRGFPPFTKRIDQASIDPDTRGLGEGSRFSALNQIPAKSWAAFFTFKASSSNRRTKKRHLRVAKGLLGFPLQSSS